jgi:hypothetical protein
MIFWSVLTALVLALFVLLVHKRMRDARPFPKIVLEKGVTFPDDGQGDVSVEQMGRAMRKISKATEARLGHGWLYVRQDGLSEDSSGKDLAVRVREHFKLPDLPAPTTVGASPTARGRLPDQRKREVVVTDDSPVRIGKTSMGAPIAAVWSLPGEPTSEPDFG